MHEIDPALVLLETPHWIVNHGAAATLPGYVFVAARSGDSLAAQSGEALAELGPLLARVQSAIEGTLGAERVYVGRFGHSPGWPVHFHLVPVYAWLRDALAADARYSHLRGHHGHAECTHDGADILLYAFREWTTAEGRGAAPPAGTPSVADAVSRLRAGLAG
jgi:diadenosine tetraphosphate (Ap4A) HIT family hydrolase